MGRLSALSHSLLILLLGCVCSGWTQVQSADLQRLESEIREALEQSGIPGAGIALVRNGDVLWAGGVGLADRSSSRPVSGQTLYPLGSISKTFVGMAVVRLNQEGKLDLQEPVRKLIPEVEFQNRWENTDPVRLIHLLEHTSGIDDLRFAELFRDGRTIARSGPRRVRWQPGTFFSYSSVGSNVAAEIVERVTGLKFDDYVRTHFFDPLQMSSSSFSLEFDMQGSLATGYAADGKTPVPFQPIPFRPSGSLVSTPADMARFLEFMVTRGRAGENHLLEETSIEQMETPTTPLSARTGLMVGYGLGISTSVQEGIVVHGHVGGIGPYRARYAYSPGHQIGYAVMLSSPREDVLRRLSNLLLRYLMRDLTLPIPPEPASVPLSRLRALTGYYVSATQNRDLLRFYENLVKVVRIEVQDDRVLADPVGGEAERLIPVTDRRFRGENEPLPTIVFVEDGGDLLIVGHSAALAGNYRLRPLWIVWGLWVGAACCLVLVFSVPLFAVVWIPRLWLGRIPAQEPLGVRIWPLLASLSLLFAGLLVWFLPSDYIRVLGRFSFWSATLYLLSWLFPVFSVLAVIECLKVIRRPKNQSIWLYSLTVTIACLIISGYFAYFGMIGVKTW